MRYILSLFAAMAIFLVMAAPAQATETSNFIGNFNTNNFSQWSSVHEGADGDCCDVGAYQGHASSAEMVVEPGDQFSDTSGERAEVVKSNDSAKAHEGDYQHLSWAIYFKSTLALESSAGHWNIFTQWHESDPDDSCSPPVSFDIDSSSTPYHWYLTVLIPTQHGATCIIPQDADHVKHYDLGEVNTGVWTNFDFYVRWSSNPAVGTVRVLVNGVTKKATTSVATLYPNDSAYLKMGFYRAPSPRTNTVYLDHIHLYDIT